MRTTTLLTAALGVVGAATAFAQVYSINTVGYVNTTVCPGWNLISNPLNNKGTGGNAIENILAGVPSETLIYLYRGGFVDSTWNFPNENEWSTPGLVIAPGEGFWLWWPSSTSGTITFVGDVMEGALSTPIPQGFSMKGSMVPQAGLLQTDLKFPPVNNDIISTFTYGPNCTNPGFVTYNFGFPNENEWDAQPTIGVGQGFWVYREGQAGNWTRDFTVPK